MKHRSNQALKVALAAVEQLTREQQKKLTERLITTITRQQNITVLYLQGIPRKKQTRLAELLDKNNEGQLNRKERTELKQLGSEVDQIFLANSHAFALALRPELFNERGQPIKSRFRHVVGTLNSRRAVANHEDA